MTATEVPPVFLSNSTVNAIQKESYQAHSRLGIKSILYGRDERRLRLLMEKVGKIAGSLNEADVGNQPVDEYKLEQDLIQLAAMAATWVEGKHI